MILIYIDDIGAWNWILSLLFQKGASYRGGNGAIVINLHNVP